MKTSARRNRALKSALIAVAIVVVAAVLIAGMIFRNNIAQGYQQAGVTTGLIETYYTFSGAIESNKVQTAFSDLAMQISSIRVKEGDEVTINQTLIFSTDDDRVRTKIAGTVDKIFVDVNQQVPAGAPLCEIIDFRDLKAVIKVDEYDLQSIKIGDSISIFVSAANKSVKGVVSEISRTGSSQNGIAYFTANVNLLNIENIRVGMTCEARILNEKAENALLIPMKALSFDEGNTPFVYVMAENGQLSKASIECGITDGKNVQILDGLTDGQTVYYPLPSTQNSGLTVNRNSGI